MIKKNLSASKRKIPNLGLIFSQLGFKLFNKKVSVMSFLLEARPWNAPEIIIPCYSRFPTTTAISQVTLLFQQKNPLDEEFYKIEGQTIIFDRKQKVIVKLNPLFPEKGFKWCKIKLISSQFSKTLATIDLSQKNSFFYESPKPIKWPSTEKLLPLSLKLNVEIYNEKEQLLDSFTSLQNIDTDLG